MQLLKDLEKEDPSLASIPEQNPSLSDVKSLYLSYVSTWRQDIRGLYRKYSLPAESTSTDRNLLNPLPEIPVVTPSSRRRSSIAAIAFKAKFPKQSKPLPSAIKLDPNVTMSAEAFATFLKVSQSRQHVGVNEAAAIIAKYDTFTKKRDTDHITLKGFAHYLLAQEASPPPQLPLKQLQKMDQPLSDYMIASSHNTYLTGHQLHGESSVSMYAKVWSMEPPNNLQVKNTLGPFYREAVLLPRSSVLQWNLLIRTECIYKSTFGLSFVGRFVLFRSVPYRRFHCTN